LGDLRVGGRIVAGTNRPFVVAGGRKTRGKTFYLLQKYGVANIEQYDEGDESTNSIVSMIERQS
jgi:hypothetical protein